MSPEEIARSRSRDKAFDEAFLAEVRRSKVYREDSVSSNSALDRIETNKLNVADILGNSDLDHVSQAAGSKQLALILFVSHVYSLR